jgi:hypothetical protein
LRRPVILHQPNDWFSRPQKRRTEPKKNHKKPRRFCGSAGTES